MKNILITPIDTTNIDPRDMIYFDPRDMISCDHVFPEPEYEPNPRNALEEVDIVVTFMETKFYIRTLVNLPESVSEPNLANISALVATVPDLHVLLNFHKLVYIKYDSKIIGVIGCGSLLEHNFCSLPFKMCYSDGAEYECFGEPLGRRDYFIIIMKDPIEI